jgi:hypothetical protein
MPGDMMDLVRAALEPDEVDYGRAARLGPDSLPALSELVGGSAGPGMAAKAAYLASLIGGPDSADVVRRAAASAEPAIRVAAASGLRNLATADLESVARSLLDDDDVGVRKTTLIALGAGLRDSPLLRQVNHLAERDSEPRLRILAAEAVSRMQGL